MTSTAERYLAAKRTLFDIYFDGLNEQQQKAIYHINHPLLILAGAGSGKTTVLVRRIAYIIRFGNAYESNYVPYDLDDARVEALEAAALNPPGKAELEAILSQFSNSPCPPWRILAITFTNKAANEIKARLAAAFPDDPELASSIWAGTFHSICMRILRRYSGEAGLKSGFTIYDADDSKKAMQAVLRELNIDEKVVSVKSALSAVERAKEQLIEPSGFEATFGNDYRYRLMGKAYAAYQERLAASNALDFNDIIVRTVRLLENNTNIREGYQRQFRYVSVDEYQDTNGAQFKLTALLSGGYENLMAVGDDDQSIYKFRGATIENILNFDRVFPSATVIRLEQNYRSTKYILDAANAVIANNKGRRGKTLWTDRAVGKRIHVLTPDNQNAEARAILDVIQHKVARKERHYRDFAVLYRTNAQSQALENAFARSAVPYRMLGGVRFSDRKEIRDIVAYLQLINNHADQERLLRIVNEPRRKIGDRTLSAISEIAAQKGLSMFEVMEHADEYMALARSSAGLMSFCALINELTLLLPTMPLSQFVDEVLDRSGYRQMIKDMGAEEADRLDNLQEFISGVMEYEKESERPSLTEFLEETALVADVDRYDESADAVVMMTIHSAKGLEFNEVFLPGFEEGIFPGRQTVMEGPAEMEEERRLCYVAITRAKDELYILHTNVRTLYGMTAHNPASRFLSEIPETLIDEEKIEKTEASPAFEPMGRKIDRQNSRSPRFSEANLGFAGNERMSVKSAPAIQPGQRVRHMLFGEGIILSAQKMGSDILYEIAFDTKGTKKLMGNYAKLTII